MIHLHLRKWERWDLSPPRSGWALQTRNTKRLCESGRRHSEWLHSTWFIMSDRFRIMTHRSYHRISSTSGRFMAVRELFKWLATVLGLQDAPVYAIYLTITVSVLLFILSQPWIAHSSYQADGGGNECERSKEVDIRRYGEELAAAKTLAGKFILLRFATRTLRCCLEPLFHEADQEWRRQYEEAAVELGWNAPVLNLCILSTGAPTCGIHTKVTS